MINRSVIQFIASAVLTSAAVTAAPAIASSWFSSLLPSLKHQTNIPILLPNSLSPLKEKAYPYATGKKNSYIIQLGAVSNCNGASACAIAYITGAKPKYRLVGQKIKLAKGITGSFTPKKCEGRHCDRAELYWVYGNAVYGVEAVAEQAPLVSLANSAIMGGPR